MTKSKRIPNFQQAWLEDTSLKDWLQHIDGNTKCIICSKTLNNRYCELKNHALSKEHKANEKKNVVNFVPSISSSRVDFYQEDVSRKTNTSNREIHLPDTIPPQENLGVSIDGEKSITQKPKKTKKRKKAKKKLNKTLHDELNDNLDSDATLAEEKKFQEKNKKTKKASTRSAPDQFDDDDFDYFSEYEQSSAHYSSLADGIHATRVHKKKCSYKLLIFIRNGEKYIVHLPKTGYNRFREEKNNLKLRHYRQMMKPYWFVQQAKRNLKKKVKKRFQKLHYRRRLCFFHENSNATKKSQSSAKPTLNTI